MGVLSQDIASDKKLKLGHFAIDPTAEAVADGDRFFQRHAAILGSTGSGKSYTVAALLERTNALSHPNLVLLDMHGEYASLASDYEAPGGAKNGYADYLKIAGPGDLVGPKPNSLFLPFWLLNREEMLSMLLDRSDDNAPNQAMRFTNIVFEQKKLRLQAGAHDDVLASFTVDSPVPYDLTAVLVALKADDEGTVVGASGKDIKGPWNGKLTRFISRLEAKIADRRYGFLFQPPSETSNYEWLHQVATRFLSAKSSERPGIKVVDFSEVPPDVLPTVVSVLARILYDVQFWMGADSRTPVCLVCDEAHLYLPVRADADAAAKRALDTFERIAKEGRKYGFALLVVSQRPSDVSKTILSQCNNFIALRLTNEQDQSAVKSVMPDSMAGIADVLPLLDIGEAIVLGDSILLPSRIKLDMPKARPLSLTKNFWKEWGEKPSKDSAIKSAVESLRMQSKGSEKKPLTG
jgi:DNA helicase HerA-like ATPase